jgi:hypothetical protein
MKNSSQEQEPDPAKQLPAWYQPVMEGQSCFPMYEHLAQQGFPTVNQLRDGILLGCIAHALWLAANQGQFAHNHCWDGSTYVDDNDQGERWAVDFQPEGAVAVFYSTESPRNPFPKNRPPYDQAKYFQGMPDGLSKAKDRALAWMVNLDRGMGGPRAAITSAMWATANRFTACEPWGTVFHNSLWSCYRQVLPLEVAVMEWREDCALDDEGVAVLRSLYDRRRVSSETMIHMHPWERDVFLRGHDRTNPVQESDDPDLSAARETLASIGIALWDES